MLLPSKWLPLCCTRLPLCCADVACRKTACRELPAVCARRKSCLPFFLPAESAEKEPCLLTDPALYTAAAWPRLYCRLTGPVQPITAWRLLASAAAQPMRPLPLCTCKQLERYTPNKQYNLRYMQEILVFIIVYIIGLLARNSCYMQGLF
jgi:hypothetical protein